MSSRNPQQYPYLYPLNVSDRHMSNPYHQLQGNRPRQSNSAAQSIFTSPTASRSTRRPSSHRSESHPASNLPPSLREAAQNVHYPATYAQSPYDNRMAGPTPSSRMIYEEIPANPNSFFGRSLASPEMQWGLEAFSDELFLPPSLLPPAFSTPPEDMNAPSLVNSDGTASNRTSDGSLIASTSTGSICDDYRLGPYHLLGTSATSMDKENIPNGSSTSLSSQHSQTLSASNDNQRLACDICPARYFNGQWAHRNLNRHMEQNHTPSERFRCTQPGCLSTFGRKDALLVHERKHPELQRSPPIRRGRSAESASSQNL